MNLELRMHFLLQVYTQENVFQTLRQQTFANWEKHP